MDVSTALTAFGVIFAAELPDKTALTCMVMATRQRPLAVFLGAGFALTLQALLAVAAGGALSMLPARAVHIGAGVVFLLAALMMWRKSNADDEDEPSPESMVPRPFGKALAGAFGLVFIAELGDLTQVGTAALAARYDDPLSVFLGSASALWTVSAIAVFLGSRLHGFLGARRTSRAAAILLAAVGVALLVTDIGAPPDATPPSSEAPISGG